jgi:putative DNA primase/helicase
LLTTGYYTSGRGRFTTIRRPSFRFISCLTPTTPQAPEPERWHGFLDDLWNGDQDSKDTLQEILGYLLGGGTRQQQIFLLARPRRSGRGTIARVTTGLLGAHNVSGPTMSSLGTNFGLQDLIGKPLAIVGDARFPARSEDNTVVERLLSISGEDILTIDRKYKEPWTGRLPTRFLILTNELPKLADASNALSGRIVPLVFTLSFYGRENPELTEELLREAPGIFNWALRGLDRLNERGHFVVPPASQDAITQLEDLASPVGAFVRQCCVTGSNYQVDTDDLWKAWKDWCEDQNVPEGTKSIFVRDLRAVVSTIRPTRLTEGQKRVQGYVGIALLVDPTV